MTYPKGYSPTERTNSEFDFRHRNWYVMVSILISVIISYTLGEVGIPSLIGYNKIFTSFPLSFISMLITFGLPLFFLPLLLIAKLHAHLTVDQPQT